MKVKSIAECSLGAFCNTCDLHQAIIGLENQFLVFSLCGRLRLVLLYPFLCRTSGLEVMKIGEEKTKLKSSAELAAEFRNKRLYASGIPRETSKCLCLT